MQSASGPIRKVGGRGGGGCLPYDDLYLGLCARVIVRGEWSGGGGRQLVPEGGISYEWGGGGGGGRPPRAYGGSGGFDMLYVSWPETTFEIWGGLIISYIKS